MWPTTRLMFQARTKFTRKFRKLPLTTKDINKGFYKGTRTGSMGRHTRFGGYIIEWDKVRTYVVPEGLDTFKVRERWTTLSSSLLFRWHPETASRKSSGMIKADPILAT
jgi:hypothetical protein